MSLHGDKTFGVVMVLGCLALAGLIYVAVAARKKSNDSSQTESQKKKAKNVFLVCTVLSVVVGLLLIVKAYRHTKTRR